MQFQLSNTKNSFFLLGFSLCFPFLLSAPAAAHPLDVVYVEVVQNTNSDFKTCMSIHPTPLKKILNSEIIDEARAQKNIFFDLLQDGASCPASLAELTPTEASVSLCYELKCPKAGKDFRFKFNFSDGLDEKFVVLGKFKNGSGESIFKLDRKNNETAFVAATADFISLGMNHIGATSASWTGKDGSFQIADGIDHILFVLALLLISSGWRGLLINISGFTLGHSVSLALALTKILVLPPSIIEPAIALTIAYVALRGVRQKKDESLLVTIGFGFLHGMGFSYVLQGLHTASICEFCKTLLLFNAGIEAGQLLIVLLLSPLLYYLLKKGRFAKLLASGMCAFIFILAVYWAVQRSLPLFAS